MLCPRCDEQGEVQQFVIKKTGERVNLCDECDALWVEGERVTVGNFVDFSTCVARFGLAGTWDEVEAVSAEIDQ